MYYIILRCNTRGDTMNQSILSVRVDSDDKKNFETFCNETGMNVSTAINMFIKAVLREQKLPFEIKSDKYEEEVYTKLLEAEESIKNNSKLYSSDEVLNTINKIIGD